MEPGFVRKEGMVYLTSVCFSRTSRRWAGEVWSSDDFRRLFGTVLEERYQRSKRLISNTVAAGVGQVFRFVEQCPGGPMGSPSPVSPGCTCAPLHPILDAPLPWLTC